MQDENENERRAAAAGITSGKGCGTGLGLVLLTMGLLALWVIIGGAPGNDRQAANGSIASETGNGANLPTLVLPSGELADNEIELAGMAEPNGRVDVFRNGQLIGQTAADENGNWSYTAYLESENDHFEAVSYGSDGSQTGSSGAVYFAGTLIAPDPTEFAMVQTTLDRADVDPDSKSILLGGEATPGSTVLIGQNGALAGETTADNSGQWTYTAEAQAYQNDMVVIGLDAGGNPVAQDERRVYVPAASRSLTFGDLAVDEVTAGDGVQNGKVRWSGIGEPNADVELYADGILLGRTQSDSAGNWAFNGDFSLPAQEHDFSVRLFNRETGDLISESEKFVFAIPAAGGLVELDPIQAGTGSYEAVELSGIAPAGSIVQIIIDGEVVDEVEVDADGRWAFSGFFGAGDHETALRVVDMDGVEIGALSGQAFSIGNVGGAAGGVAFEPANSDNGGLRVLFVAPDAAAGDGDASGEGDSDAGSNQDDDGSGSAENGASLSDFLAGSPAVELIVDASWSMTLDMSGENRLTADDPNSRIAVAQVALDDMLANSLPAGVPIAVRSFGNIEGDLSCRTDLMVPLQGYDQEVVQPIVDNILPKFNANTAIAAALSQVGSDLAGTDREKTIILLTDGEETCGGDPAAEIQKLIDQGINARVNVIGFAINDPVLKATFEEWAALGNGMYFDAQDADQLVDALSQTLVTRYVVRNAAGETAAIGIVGGSPVELPAGLYSVSIQGFDKTFENVAVRSGELLELVEK